MVDIAGVLNVFEADANKVPAVAAEYQLIVSPFPGVAEIEIVPLPHLEAELAVGAIGKVFIVAIDNDLEADTHPVVVIFAST